MICNCKFTMIETKKGFYCNKCGYQFLKYDENKFDKKQYQLDIGSDNFDLMNNRSL